MSSVQQSAKYDPTNPYHIYYNIDVINNETTGNNIPKPFKILETRNAPFIGAPENYFLSVVRFSLQSPSLPVFIPAILLGQMDVNRTAYSMTMTYKTYETPQSYITYTPQDLSQPSPLPPLTKQDLTSDYYNVYSYQHWMVNVNTCMSNCFNLLKAQAVANGDNSLNNILTPYMEFDVNTQNCTINADINGFNKTLANPIRIYFNTALHTLYNNFPDFKIGYGSSSNGKNFLLDIYSINGSNIFQAPQGNYLQMYQEGQTTALLNPIQSIVFTTALLPIIPELVSPSKTFNSDTQLQTNGYNVDISPIITDFIVPFSAINTYKPNIDYTPNGEYRLCDLYGATPVNSIELSVFWKDIYGNLHPFYVDSGCSGNIKLLFRRKDFNK